MKKYLPRMITNEWSCLILIIHPSIFFYSSNNTTSVHIYDMYDLGSKTKKKIECALISNALQVQLVAVND